MDQFILTLLSNLLSDSMTVDPLVAWPLSTTLNGSLFHTPITGVGRSYGPILTGAAANCTADAEVMNSGGEAPLPMLSQQKNNQRGGSV